MKNYYLGSHHKDDHSRIGQKIYHEALADRRGFRPDQIGISESDDVWMDIFKAIGEAASNEMRARERPRLA
jgi:hypothetical protein